MWIFETARVRKMIKLDLPIDTVENTFDSCLSDISDSQLEYITKLFNAKNSLIAQSELYVEKAFSIDLHVFVPSRRARPDDLVPECGDEVTKGDLVKLYKDTLSRAGTRSRKIYNRIKLSSGESCSICVVGTVTTLDHYLPKARYPAFSVDPNNLIPACAECNKGKGASLLSAKEDHVLHPYFSDGKFYNDKWLKAEVIESLPVRLRFYVDAPESWDESEVTLITKHFDSFSLGDKYSLYIACHLITAIDGVDRSINIDTRTLDSIKGYFIAQARSRPSVNSPVAAMYRALSDSDWFCSESRQDTNQGYI